MSKMTSSHSRINFRNGAGEELIVGRLSPVTAGGKIGSPMMTYPGGLLARTYVSVQLSLGRPTVHIELCPFPRAARDHPAGA